MNLLDYKKYVNACAVHIKHAELLNVSMSGMDSKHSNLPIYFVILVVGHSVLLSLSIAKWEISERLWKDVLNVLSTAFLDALFILLDVAMEFITVCKWPNWPAVPESRAMLTLQRTLNLSQIR